MGVAVNKPGGHHPTRCIYYFPGIERQLAGGDRGNPAVLQRQGTAIAGISSSIANLSVGYQQIVHVKTPGICIYRLLFERTGIHNLDLL
ncbi:hypothetical protein ACFQH7_21495 [Microbulbifer taiwanensis]